MNYASINRLEQSTIKSVPLLMFFNVNSAPLRISTDFCIRSEIKLSSTRLLLDNVVLMRFYSAFFMLFVMLSLSIYYIPLISDNRLRFKQ